MLANAHHRSGFLLLVSMIAATGCARATSDSQPSLQENIRGQLQSPVSFAAVHDSLGGARMFVDCQMDGNAELCMVDTGSEYSQVSDSVAGLDHYVSLGSVFNRGLGNPTFVRSDFIQVQNFSMLGISLGGVKLLREGPSVFDSALSNNGVKGVVGNDIFSAYEMYFDFSAKQMHFEQPIPSALTQHDLTVLPSHHVVMKATLNGDSVNALWDTGSSFTMVDQAYVEAHPANFTYVQDLDQETDTTGQHIATKLYRAKNLSIEDLSFSDVLVGVTSFQNASSFLSQPVQVLIGYNVLSQANWYLDFPNKHWAAERH